ncbi:MAG: hypothetical protein HC879_07590 [Leptolyngbyaceae cyanobacterium SL_5_9]|nr:hypothetical protein [Leptolyngbyaceae cyanobacterium SL_5_9]
MGFETSALGILAVTALGLMVAFTGGIAYLTTIEWRDRAAVSERCANRALPARNKLQLRRKSD